MCHAASSSGRAQERELSKGEPIQPIQRGKPYRSGVSYEIIFLIVNETSTNAIRLFFAVEKSE